MKVFMIETYFPLLPPGGSFFSATLLTTANLSRSVRSFKRVKFVQQVFMCALCLQPVAARVDDDHPLRGRRTEVLVHLKHGLWITG